MCVCTLPSDNCKKMGLVFDDVVGIIEIINCKDVKIQVCAVVVVKMLKQLFSTAALRQLLYILSVTHSSMWTSTFTKGNLQQQKHVYFTSHQLKG